MTSGVISARSATGVAVVDRAIAESNTVVKSLEKDIIGSGTNCVEIRKSLRIALC